MTIAADAVRLADAHAARLTDGPATPRWWHEAVFYQVYPRSFADANGDGIGDLAGIIDRLDYLADLGIDAIWLSPHYPSPQRDMGYDIADYMDVHAEYGTLDDFRRLVQGAHARGIRLVLDLVLNHTSDQHPWFEESRSSRTNPKRDWYIWRDGRADGAPNNWVSQFGGSAWQLDKRTGQYYYHCFLTEQPDLNWHNPEVRAAMWAAVRFWLDLGVDGFRLDAIGNLFKDPAVPDHTSTDSLYELRRRWLAATSDEDRGAVSRRLSALFAHQLDQPGIHELMRELRKVVDAYPDRVLIGETEQVAFYGDGRDELDLVFDFPLLHGANRGAPWIAHHLVDRWATMPVGTWPAVTLGNHDDSRVRTRAAALGGDDLATARLAAALILTLPGTPFLYNGEEIGMTDLLLTDHDQLRDAWALWFHDATIQEGGLTPDAALALVVRFSRDRSRTPMQWTAGVHAGFGNGSGPPWLPVNPDHLAGVNVADQRGDAGSLLRFYRRLLRVRRRSPALLHGDCVLLHAPTGVLAYLRTSAADRDACLVVLNMSGVQRRLRFDLPGDALHTRFSSRPRAARLERPSRLTVGPYEAYLAELE